MPRLSTAYSSLFSFLRFNPALTIFLHLPATSGFENSAWGRKDTGVCHVKFRHLNRYTGAGLAALAAFTAVPVAAKSSVSLDSAVFVERQQTGNIRSLEPAQRLIRGDRVVTVLTWQRLQPISGGNGGFTVTNPLPRDIAYQDSAGGNEDVSVDGGRSWGKLGILRKGSRMATPEDVTHVRWRVAASHAVKSRGQIAYSGIVR